MVKLWFFLFITISSVIQVSHEWICSSSSSNSEDTEETNVGSSGSGGSNEYSGNRGDDNNWDGGPLGPYQSPSGRRGGAWGGNGFTNEITDDDGNPPTHHKNLDNHLGEPGINNLYYGANGGGNGLEDEQTCSCDKKKKKKEKKEKEKHDKEAKKRLKQEQKERHKKEKEEKKKRQKEEKERRKKEKKEKKEKKKKCKCKKHKKHK